MKIKIIRGVGRPPKYSYLSNNEKIKVKRGVVGPPKYLLEIIKKLY